MAKWDDNNSIFKTSFCKVGQLLWLAFFFSLLVFYFNTLIDDIYEQAQKTTSSVRLYTLCFMFARYACTKDVVKLFNSLIIVIVVGSSKFW